MASFKLGFTILPAVFFLVTSTVTAYVLVCPPEREINPCSCTLDPEADRAEASCKSNMTNGHLSKVFERIQLANGLNSTSLLTFFHFGLSGTNLTSLDWSPFPNFRFQYLSISKNPNIRSYVGPSSTFGLVQVWSLFMNSNNITESRFGDTLKQFSPGIVGLNLADNQLTGVPTSTTDNNFKVQSQLEHKSTYSELLPGLRALVNLKIIDLGSNKIQKLNPGSFYSNNRLQDLDLNNNELVKIGPDAFLLAPPPVELNSTLVYVNLKENKKLGEAGFSPEAGLDRLGRPVQLDLTFCNFTTLHQSTFGKFLRAHPENIIFLQGNPIVCDESTDWLREPDSAKIFKGRVKGGACKNSPRKTLFTWGESGKHEGELVCLPTDKIQPCSCTWDVDEDLWTVLCESNMTSNHLSKVLESLRAANELNSTALFTFFQFELSGTNLTSLDWSPLANLRVNRLVITNNNNINSYVGPPANFGPIKVWSLWMYKNITESRFGDTLKQFSPEMEELNLLFNHFTGEPKAKGQSQGQHGSSYLEFLPGLSALINLQKIDLQWNKIQKLRPGSFYNNNRLKLLMLWSNELEEIEPDALLLAPPPVELNDTLILISLGGNKNLGEAGFSSDSGVDRLGRPVKLSLTSCNFTTIPQATFEKFLRAHPENKLDLEENPLVCDESTDWLREPESKKTYQNRVLNGVCQNAPEKTLFTWENPGRSETGGIDPSNLLFVFLFGLVVAMVYKGRGF